MPQPPPPYLEATGARPYGQIRVPTGVISVFRAPDGRLYTDYPDVGGPFRHNRSLQYAICRRFGCQAHLEVTQDGAPSPALAEERLPLLPPSNQLVASVAEAASALTLQRPEDLSSEVLLDYVSTEESDSDDSSDEEESVDDLSLGSKILIRKPPKWYQVYFIRTDSSGLFHMYPDLGGPFQTVDQAECAISDHLSELQSRSLLKVPETYSTVDRLIHEHNYYPDGTPKRGPNSRRRTHPNERQYYLVQALLDQYNDSKNLFGNHALELQNLLWHKLIYGKKKLYYHFNFTTKTGNLFFAELSQIEEEGAWKVTCCCILDPSENGQCNTCKNDGCPDMKHPNNTDAYIAGRLNGYFQYGDGELSESHDDIEAETARLRVLLKGLDDPDAMKRRAMQRLHSSGPGAQVDRLMPAKFAKHIFSSNRVQSKQYQSVDKAADATKFNLHELWCREPKDFSDVNGLMVDHNRCYSDRTSKSIPSSRENIDADNEWHRLTEADDIYTNSAFIFFGDESSGCDSDALTSSQGPSEPHSDTSSASVVTNRDSTLLHGNSEVSWKDMLFHGQNLMPKKVRNQGNRPSCVFQALCAASEIEKKRLAAQMDPPQECDISFSANAFIRDYQDIAGPLGSDQELYKGTRRAKALELLKNKGVLASENGALFNRQKISSYEWKGGLEFSQISDIIDSGKPIIGAIPIDSYFPRLKVNEIYDFDIEEAKMTDGGGFVKHAVVFVGYGRRGGRPYLVFLNSFGTRFGDEGYGRVYLDHVDRLNTIEF